MISKLSFARWATAVTVLAAGALCEAAETYKVDGVHSSVLFRIKHLGVSFAYGRFNEIAGEFAFDDEDPGDCTFNITVKTDSFDTNNADRDKHIKGEEFFDVEKYPEMSFKSTKVTKSEGKYEVTGDMTFHGVTKSIKVKLERTGSAKDPWGGHRVGFETTFTIKRSDFGLKAALDALSDEVRITVSIEGLRQ